MEESILTSTKKILGIDESYEAFDLDITMHINSVFMTLSQLGVGPADGYMIVDKSTKWEDYLGDDPNLNSVATYMFLRVKLLFDPPQTSHHMTALEKQIAEFEWRLNVQVDTRELLPEQPEFVFDGGEIV